MTAAARLAALDTLSASELIATTETKLSALVDVMNRETTLLRAGRFAEAAPLAADKAQLSQDYVGLARAVERQAARLKSESPQGVDRLKAWHGRLALQIADNLKVIATARTVAEDLLSDVAQQMGRGAAPMVYGAAGRMAPPQQSRSGLAINRAS